jgi:AcrR family transcriptional regulator
MSAPSVSARSKFHHGDLRNALLVETAKLVATVGADNFSLREAARGVGVSPNAAYRHFADKGALLAALAMQGFERMAMAIEVDIEAAGSDPVACLKATGTGYIRFAAAEPALFDLMFGPHGAGGPRNVDGKGLKSGKTPYDLLRSALDELVHCKRLTPARRRGADMVLWSSIHGLAVLTNSGAIDEPVDLAFARLFDFIASGLEIQPRPPQSTAGVKRRK